MEDALRVVNCAEDSVESVLVRVEVTAADSVDVVLASELDEVIRRREVESGEVGEELEEEGGEDMELKLEDDDKEDSGRTLEVD